MAPLGVVQSVAPLGVCWPMYDVDGCGMVVCCSAGVMWGEWGLGGGTVGWLRGWVVFVWVELLLLRLMIQLKEATTLAAAQRHIDGRGCDDRGH